MGRLILFNMMTLDGFFAGPDGDISWHRVDDEFNRFAVDQLADAAGLVFGRVTYELMASYWRSEQARRDDPAVTELMNTLPKTVFSRTLQDVDWEGTTLVGTAAVRAMADLKHRSVRDQFLLGSADLAATFTAARLIDEYRVMVNPVVLGDGRRLFQGAEDKLELRLVGRRTFGNGNVLLTYEPVRG